MLSKVWWYGVGVALALLLVGCGPAGQPTTPATVQPAVPTSMLAGWVFHDRHDPQVSEVITRQGDTYAIDPSWQVKSISYLYEWQGMGDPAFDYRVIERDGDQFKRDTDVVAADDVHAFLKAIDTLYPSQMLLGGYAWPDDYPTWAIEIVGEDGRRVQLFSASTGNFGDAPWNVLDNGRLYAQYDGTLAAPLSKLFGNLHSGSIATHTPDSHQPDSVAFGTIGFPPQLTYGFNGLLLIAENFGYATNALSGTLEGFIEGRSADSGVQNMFMASITGLARVELILPNGSSAPCSIAPGTGDDPANPTWKFSCTLGAAQLHQPYRFPITIDLTREEGRHLITTGEVWGKWEVGSDGLYSPLSLDVQMALAANAAAHDLLEDHVPVLTLYRAEISPTTPFRGTQQGEIVLRGTTTLNGASLRYTVGTPFTIENGQLIHWNLTRMALDKMLQDIGSLPLTQRILKAVPDVQLNMWYAEVGDDSREFPTMSLSLADRPSRYRATLPACGSFAARQLPRPDEPLRAFGFNNSWKYSQADFVLIDGKPVVNDLDLQLGQNDRGGVLPLLLPDVFNVPGQKPFERVWISAGIGRAQRTLRLYLPEKMSAEERTAYEKVASALPGQLDQHIDAWWEVTGLIMVVNDEGKLEVAACQ